MLASALRGTSALIGCAVLAALAGPARAGSSAAELRYVRMGEEVARLSVAELRQGCAVETVEVDDPYYGRQKSFYAFRAACILELGFAGLPAKGGNLLLRAADGYVRPTRTDAFHDSDAWLAFADASLTAGPDAEPAWELIDRRQVDPGPFYMLWRGRDQNDPHRYPWPYQLVAIEVAPLESQYPHLLPGAAPGSEAAHGFDLFRDQCVSCHAINGEGGTVGPDLNVPQSIVEYRPAEQIRAYIRDPQSFRFTSMPSHRHLSDEELDALLAYFHAMSQRKHLPGAKP